MTMTLLLATGIINLLGTLEPLNADNFGTSEYRVLQNLCNKNLQSYCTKVYIVYGLVWLVWSVLPLSYLLQLI